jgi:hypothetical protein
MSMCQPLPTSGVSQRNGSCEVKHGAQSLAAEEVLGKAV